MLFGELAERCPDALVTRAQSTLGVVVGAATPLGPVGVGAVADAVSPAAAVACCAGAFAVLLGAGSLLRWRARNVT